jgi:hypothetical protein
MRLWAGVHDEFFAHKTVLRGLAWWILVMRQVLDGPPGVINRRLSTFLLIPVGLHRRGFAFLQVYLAFRKLSLESHGMHW